MELFSNIDPQGKSGATMGWMYRKTIFEYVIFKTEMSKGAPFNL